jgi:nondiscriminating aspartyl-tRNA synthetase
MLPMKKLFISDVIHKVGTEVELFGWVDSKRDHKNVVFIDLIDRTGKIQIVGNAAFSELGLSDVVKITGLVKRRPEKLINPKLKTGEIEIEAKKFEILSKSHELPFDFNNESLDLTLPTLLDYRSLTLRHPKIQAIFKVQEALIEGFRKAAHEMKCIEVFVPTISASATEGGAELFNFDYFEHKAFLVQSPQLYKQMMVGVFERVFLLSHIYRAEPSVTTRHLVESIQMDFELGFIESFEDLLDNLEFAYSEMIKYAQETCKEELAFLGILPSKVYKKVPRLTMREAQELIFKRTGVDHRQEKDLMPEDERELAKWALEEHDSDLVTITHFPTKKRAFYSMPDPKDPEYCLSYDLLFKGLEVSSGAQRIQSYDELVKTIKSRGMDPKGFYMYLQAFQFGMPPHGGFSYGLERTTMKLLNLENIREASLYPRDMERVDIRLSTLNDTDKRV